MFPGIRHTRGPVSRAAVRRLGRLVTLALTSCLVSGCLAPGPARTPRQQSVADAARPILTMDPDAVWTDAYNRLVDQGESSIDYLMRQPALTRPAAPDDLQVLLHLSLVRLLADPRSRPPRLSASCLETTLGVLHFDLKAGGQRLGTAVLPLSATPRAWHELYPADFDHAVAASIDLEADRRALRGWWRAARARSSPPVTAPRLRPSAGWLWRLLPRRLADRWEYQPEPRALHCVLPVRDRALIDMPTRDYNLVRAACIWLGASSEPNVQRQLIELVASPSPIVAHNARFALHYSPDERIRSVLKRYAGAGLPAAPSPLLVDPRAARRGVPPGQLVWAAGRTPALSLR